MSRAYDSLEPSVIDEKLLRTCVDEQVLESQSEAAQVVHSRPNNDTVPVIRNANTSAIDFSEVTQLRLDYRNVCRIDNLWQFTNLTKLQLDNNIIERLEGLESLTGLTLLDVSFNNLECISGVDKLVNLEDLILNNNRITKIEGIETLKKLRVLNLSTNLIRNHEDILKLRPLLNLKSMILKDNCFSCNKDEYYDFVVAFLPALEYLDYRLVQQKRREAAQLRFETKLDEFNSKENTQKLRAERALKELERLNTFRRSHVLQLSKARESKNSLFLNMFQEDDEGLLLLERPEICKITATFKDEVEKEEQYLFKFGMQEYEKRVVDLTDLETAMRYAVEDARADCIEKIDEFLLYKREALGRMVSTAKASVAQDNALHFEKEEYEQLLDSLKNYLMMVETDLVDRLEEALDEFGRNYKELVGVFMEQSIASFAKFRELQTEYFERVKEVAVEASEKIARGDDQAARPKDNPYTQAMLALTASLKQGDENEQNGAENEFDDFDDDDEDMFKLTEDAKIKIYADKETVTNAATASSDQHNAVIDLVEDALKESVDKELSEILNRLETSESKRNRSRLAEITKFINTQKNDVMNVVMVI